MEIKLNGKHLAIMFACFLLGGIIGYLIKPDNNCPGVIQTKTVSTSQANASPEKRTNQISSQAQKNSSAEVTHETRPPVNSSAMESISHGSPKTLRTINRIARELKLTSSQQYEALSIIEKNYPNQEYLNGEVDASKALKTLDELKPLLTEEQSAKIQEMVMKELMKKGISF